MEFRRKNWNEEIDKIRLEEWDWGWKNGIE